MVAVKASEPAIRALSCIMAHPPRIGVLSPGDTGSTLAV
jgi:hypothetical protein